LAFSFLLSLALSKGSFPAAFSELAKIENAVRAPLAEHVTGKAWGRIAATEIRATPQTLIFTPLN
jgi:hypothetical protein